MSKQSRILGSALGSVGILWLLLVIICPAVAAVAHSSEPLSQTNIFAPASTPAKSIAHLSVFVLVITGIIIAVVFDLIV